MVIIPTSAGPHSRFYYGIFITRMGNFFNSQFFVIVIAIKLRVVAESDGDVPPMLTTLRHQACGGWCHE
jgi:prolipoprotein diacylglyceryltransferase